MANILTLLLVALVCLFIGYYIARQIMRRRDIPHALRRSRSVISGNVVEQMAPFLPDFLKHMNDLKPTEARFLGKPVDYLFFKGIDEHNITDVIFVEVKSGKSSLNDHERTLRDAIQAKRVEWRQYTAPEEATNQICRENTPSPRC